MAAIMMNSNGRVMVVKNKGTSMEASVYTSELEAVKDMLNNGSMGSHANKITYYGSPEHMAALQNVLDYIAIISANAAKPEADYNQ